MEFIFNSSDSSIPTRSSPNAAAFLDSLPGTLSPVVIRGHNFESGAPIEVLLDGHPVESERKTLVDKGGEFTISIRPPSNVGGHTILVRQKTSHGVVQDAYTFNVTVKDSKDSKR